MPHPRIKISLNKENTYNTLRALLKLWEEKDAFYNLKIYRSRIQVVIWKDTLSRVGNHENRFISWQYDLADTFNFLRFWQFKEEMTVKVRHDVIQNANTRVTIYDVNPSDTDPHFSASDEQRYKCDTAGLSYTEEMGFFKTVFVDETFDSTNVNFTFDPAKMIAFYSTFEPGHPCQPHVEVSFSTNLGQDHSCNT